MGQGASGRERENAAKRRIWSMVQLVASGRWFSSWAPYNILQSERRHCYVAVMIRCAEGRE